MWGIHRHCVECLSLYCRPYLINRFCGCFHRCHRFRLCCFCCLCCLGSLCCLCCLCGVLRLVLLLVPKVAETILGGGVRLHGEQGGNIKLKMPLPLPPSSSAVLCPHDARIIRGRRRRRGRRGRGGRGGGRRRGRGGGRRRRRVPCVGKRRPVLHRLYC